MPDDSSPPFKSPFLKDKSSDPWARTAVRAGSIEDVVSTDRRRRSRGPKIERRKQEDGAGNAEAPREEAAGTKD